MNYNVLTAAHTHTQQENEEISGAHTFNKMKDERRVCSLTMLQYETQHIPSVPYTMKAAKRKLLEQTNETKQQQQQNRRR